MISKNMMREIMPHKGIDKLIQFLDETVWSPSSTHEGDHTTKPISMEEISIATGENNISKKENDITMDVDFFKWINAEDRIANTTKEVEANKRVVDTKNKVFQIVS